MATPGHADVALHARMVGVVAAVGGEIEGDRKAHLAAGQVAPIEGVGLLGGGKARVLADRPRVGAVHGRVGPAQERRQAGPSVQEIDACEVPGAVVLFDGDALGRLPGFAGPIPSGWYRLGRSGAAKGHCRKIGKVAHEARSSRLTGVRGRQ